MDFIDNIGRALKIVALVFLIIDAIAFFFLFLAMRYIVSEYGVDSQMFLSHLISTLIVSLIGLLSVCLIYGFGTVVEKLEEMTFYQKEMYCVAWQYSPNNPDNNPNHPNNPRYNRTQYAEPKSQRRTYQPDPPGKTWICKKCGAHNAASQLSCKDCGAYK